MDIGFVWDETKYKKVLAEHDVKFYEVVAAFDDPQALDIPDPAESQEDRWLLIAMTPWGRLLAIVFTEQDAPLRRLVTAYDKYYRRR